MRFSRKEQPAEGDVLERPSDDVNYTFPIHLEWNISKCRLRREGILPWLIVRTRPKVSLTMKKAVDLREGVILYEVFFPG